VFWTLSMLLMVLWLMGMVTDYTLGGAIHVLPVAAVVFAILGGMRRRRRPLEWRGDDAERRNSVGGGGEMAFHGRRSR